MIVKMAAQISLKIDFFRCVASFCCIFWFLLTCVFAGVFGWSYSQWSNGVPFRDDPREKGTANVIIKTWTRSMDESRRRRGRKDEICNLATIRELTDTQGDAGNASWSRLLPTVFDQGNCGSCYANAAASILSFYSTYLTKPDSTTEVIQSFLPSRQYMTSCMMQSGCNGGSVLDIFAMIETAKGFHFPTEGFFTYAQSEMILGTNTMECPFESVWGECSLKNSLEIVEPALEEAKLFLSGTMMLEGKSDVDRFLTHIGPVVANVDASMWDISWTEKAIPEEWCNNSKKTDHQVLLTGIKTYLDKTEYTLKNSWGRAWGDGGSAILTVDAGSDANGPCGIFMEPFLVPVLENTFLYDMTREVREEAEEEELNEQEETNEEI